MLNKDIPRRYKLCCPQVAKNVKTCHKYKRQLVKLIYIKLDVETLKEWLHVPRRYMVENTSGGLAQNMLKDF